MLAHSMRARKWLLADVNLPVWIAGSLPAGRRTRRPRSAVTFWLKAESLFSKEVSL